MKKTLLTLLIGTVVAGSALAQTAAPAVNSAIDKAKAKAVETVKPAAGVTTPATAKATAKATAPAATTPAATTPAAATPATATPAAAPAVGGGAGKVWVNGKVYHCEGTKFYGKTKKGEYMSEADAKAKGAHGVKGQVCAK